MAITGSGRVVTTCSRPSIGARIVSATTVEIIGRRSCPAPNDHLIAGPNCCVARAPSRCVGDAGGRPFIGGRIVSPASVRSVAAAVKPAPDNHSAAGPDRSVTFSPSRRIDGTDCRPAV